MYQTHPRALLTLALSATLVLVALGCGSDDAPADDPAPPSDVGPDVARDGETPGQDSGSPERDGGPEPTDLALADATTPDAETDLVPDLQSAPDGSELPDGAPADQGGEAPDLGSPSDGEVAPDSGADPGPSPVVWFVHISDTHVGEFPDTARRMAQFLDGALPVLQPAAVLHTGDLVDLGGDAAEWQAYADAVHPRIPDVLPAYPRYLEIPGNHDLKQEGTPNYLATSISGRAGVGLHGVSYIDTPAGTLRVIRTDTSDTQFNAANVVGFFGEEQADELLASPEPPTPPLATFVLGHHPMVGLDRLILLGSDLRMHRVIERFGATAYLCGHLHMPFISWVGDTLSVQVGSLTKPVLGTRTFALLAVDNGVISARTAPLDDDIVAQVRWPLVLITSPVNAGLGGSSPNAGHVAAGSELTVRALVFAPWQLDSVEAVLDFGEAVPLQPVDPAGPLWQVTLSAPATPGLHAVEVRATGGDDDDADTLVFEVE